MHWIFIAAAAIAAIAGTMALLGSRLPRAHTARQSARFPAPPEQVWSILNDVSGMPSWRSEIKSVEILPPRNGRRVHRETWAKGRCIEMEQTESMPYSRMAGRIATPELPFQGGWTFDLAPDAGGTVVCITEEGEIANPMARFVVYYFLGYEATMKMYLADLEKKIGAL